MHNPIIFQQQNFYLNMFQIVNIHYLPQYVILNLLNNLLIILHYFSNYYHYHSVDSIHSTAIPLHIYGLHYLIFKQYETDKIKARNTILLIFI